jgi:hypothetical protein
MKTINDLLKQTPVYTGSFSSVDDNDIAREFSTKLGGANILFATYNIDDWEGDAFVLFERNGKLYEVHGSHCSCRGLEGQWKPEVTTVGALIYRLANAGFGRALYKGRYEFEEFLLG